jgi:small neutral amino acid transporter SnatA (MarC family)
MNPATSLVGEKVFGIFLAALAIQIILSALASLGVIGPLPG